MAFKIFIGWDQRDALAYEVCCRSLLAHASVPLEIRALKHWELRRAGLFWRPYLCDEQGQMYDVKDGKPFSTGFSFTRFCVPALTGFADEWVLFCDADFLWCADVAELFDLVRDQPEAAFVVKHDHVPAETLKMGGVLQTQYARKNWSSLMLLNPSRCRSLTPFVVNNWPGSELHALCWLPEAAIGALPARWNWLEGYSDPAIEPAAVHFTRGTPDMPGCGGGHWAAAWRSWLTGDERVGAELCHDPAG